MPTLERYYGGSGFIFDSVSSNFSNLIFKSPIEIKIALHACHFMRSFRACNVQRESPFALFTLTVSTHLRLGRGYRLSNSITYTSEKTLLKHKSSSVHWKRILWDMSSFYQTFCFRMISLDPSMFYGLLSVWLFLEHAFHYHCTRLLRKEEIIL